jgi:hypothetical protein
LPDADALLRPCTTTSVFPFSTVLPTVRQKASATQDKNLNYPSFSPQTHCRPQRSCAARRAYVLWAETSPYNGIINLGRVQISKGITEHPHHPSPSVTDTSVCYGETATDHYAQAHSES